MPDDQDTQATPTVSAEEESVSFTADELRAMEADGLTLGDAIRVIERCS